MSEESKQKMILTLKQGYKEGRITNPRKGKPLSEDTKQKIREALLGKKASEETRKKISEGLKGKRKGATLSVETRQKLSRSIKERLKDEELRKRISKSVKATISSPEFKIRFKKIMKKVCNTLEHKKKCSDRQKKLFQNPSYKKHLSEVFKQLWSDPARRKKRSEAVKKRLENPLELQKLLERVKGWHTEECKMKIKEAKKKESFKEKMLVLKNNKEFHRKKQLKTIKTKIEKGLIRTDKMNKEKIMDLYLVQNLKISEIAKILRISDVFLEVYLQTEGIEKFPYSCIETKDEGLNNPLLEEGKKYKQICMMST